ncbi:MAG: PIG-L family deacetylase [Flavobacteriales bacterium]|nr:PIG-L family deacetylase [Flavobacteriales bacterium]
MINFFKKKVMIVVAHPDDELLGIGGTIQKLKSEYNCKIQVVILGEGITSRDTVRDIDKRNEELNTHQKNILAAKNILNYDNLSTYQFPDNRFDTVPLLDIIKVIEKEKNKMNPEVIFTHHGGDLNIDHQITFKAVITSSRPQNNEKVKSIFCFETPSATEWQSSNHPSIFKPNLFIEINENQIEKKIEAMECYEYEKRKFPHPRSPEALKILASYRGLSIGRHYAEAFELIRGIN